MNLLDELNETIQFLESQIPASPKRNEPIEKGLTKSLRQYFKNLDNALDWNELEQIYYRNIK